MRFLAPQLQQRTGHQHRHRDEPEGRLQVAAVQADAPQRQHGHQRNQPAQEARDEDAVGEGGEGLGRRLRQLVRGLALGDGDRVEGRRLVVVAILLIPIISVVQTGPRSALRLTTARYFTPSGKSVQAGGIDPDISVPQLSDPDYKDRPRVREADLRRHLLSQAKVDDKLLEAEDASKDPRFAFTAAELEKKGIEDFQLDYAIRTLKRLAPKAPSVASAAPKPKG